MAAELTPTPETQASPRPDPPQTTPDTHQGPQTRPSQTQADRIVHFCNMFRMSTTPKLRGSGLLILNILRAFNIIGLLTVVAASWVMIVLAGLKTQFFFFDAAAHFFTSTIAIFLVVSELGVFRAYFQRTWPVLGVEHSFVWLGVAMVVMGCQVLGNLNKPAASAESLGLPLWRLVLASGILSITFGFLNVVASVVFRDGKEGITARMIRNDGQLAQAPAKDVLSHDASSYSTRSASVRQEKRASRFPFRLPVRVSRLNISKPIPQEQDPEQGAAAADLHDLHHDAGACDDDTWQDDRASPIVPTIQRPPTALHPAYTGASRYSEASHLPRF